jgi:hypothetical protein
MRKPGRAYLFQRLFGALLMIRALDAVRAQDASRRTAAVAAYIAAKRRS